MPNNFQTGPEKLQINPNPGPPQEPQKTKAKAKSKTGLIIGLIIALLVIAGIGAGILYFAGVLAPGEEHEIDLKAAFSDQNLKDSYMVYKEQPTKAPTNTSGLRLDTRELINQIDAQTITKPKSFLSPVDCQKIKDDFTQNNWQFVLSSAPNSVNQQLTIDYNNPKNNKIYPLIKKGNEFSKLGDYLMDVKSFMSYPRYEYDYKSLLVAPDGGVFPLAAEETPATVKASLCEGIDSLIFITIPAGIENFEASEIKNNKTYYGAYDSHFLIGKAQSAQILKDQVPQNATKATLKIDSVNSKNADGIMVIYLSLDGGNTWIAPNEEVLLHPAPEDAFAYYPSSDTFTYTFSQVPVNIDLRMVVIAQNLTRTGVEKKNDEFNLALTEIKNQDKSFYLKKKNEKGEIIDQSTLFLSQNGSVELQVSDNTDTKFANYGIISKFNTTNDDFGKKSDKVLSEMFNGPTPFYTPVTFFEKQQVGPGIIQPPASKIESIFSLFKNPFVAGRVMAQDVEITSPQAFFSAVVLPESTPILQKAVISFETAGLPKTIGKLPEATPTPEVITPEISPVTTLTPEVSPTTTPTVEGPLDIQPSVWHRGHNRVIIKWTFTSGVDNNVNPGAVFFKYGESENIINKGAKVYKDKNDGKYYAVLRGLKGGEFSDKNEGGYVNGRHPYYFQISIADKFAPAKTFKTLNRVQTIAYYYTLLLDATYLASQDEENLKKYESLDNTVVLADKEWKVRDLENGGMAFHYKPEGKNAQSLLGVKFTMANDRKFKEFDKKLEETLKGGIGVTEAEAKKIKKEKKSEKEGVRMLYRRILDRIYDEDLGKFYDKDGIDFWVAMTDKDLIKNYYKDKDEKDIVDMYGVKFAISVSKEYQNEQFAGLASDLLAKAKADLAYQIVLKRGGDQEGVNFLTGKFTAAKDMRKHLALSTEYEIRLQDIESKFSKKSAIEELYETLYGRPSDVKGVEYWLGSGKSIFELRDTFLSSNEFTKVIKE